MILHGVIISPELKTNTGKKECIYELRSTGHSQHKKRETGRYF
jgi:hypothetical protein